MTSLQPHVLNEWHHYHLMFSVNDISATSCTQLMTSLLPHAYKSKPQDHLAYPLSILPSSLLNSISVFSHHHPNTSYHYLSSDSGDWGWCSVVEPLLKLFNGLGLIPSAVQQTSKQRNKKKRKLEKENQGGISEKIVTWGKISAFRNANWQKNKKVSSRKCVSIVLESGHRV